MLSYKIPMWKFVTINNCYLSMSELTGWIGHRISSRATTTAAKGAKLLDSFERAPIFGELYKRRQAKPPLTETS